MSLVLSINKSGLGNYAYSRRGSKKAGSLNCPVLSLHKKRRERGAIEQEGQRPNLKAAGIFLAFTVAVCGMAYLYQVNDLTNKGYEIKEIENRITELKESNEKNRIAEVELRSMYNIEKVIDDLNLVKADNVSYLELDGPMAMK